MKQTTSEPLVELGFTALEAEIYTRLLEELGVTGYRLAQLLGKAAPNVYKALESLEAKGAVMVDNGRRRLYRAVPPDELLGRLDRRFRDARERARQTLEERNRPRADHRVYQMSSIDAVLEKARAMLARASEIVLVDAFPRSLEVLRDSLQETAERGVLVAALTYDGAEGMPGVRVFADPISEVTRKRWPGDWLNLSIDGSELLISLLDYDASRVHQAIWTSSPVLALVYQNALSCEAILKRVNTLVEAGTDIADLRRELKELAPLKAPWCAGYHQLIEFIKL